MTKDEITYFKNNYLNFLIEKNENTTLCEWLEKSISFDRPDGYYYDSKTRLLIIFEHFAFDCSENIMKKGRSCGSSMRKNLFDKHQEVQKEMQSATDYYESTKVVLQGYYEQNGNKIEIKMGENGDKYRNNYINNFENAFKEHNAKIDKYKNNLISSFNIQPVEIKTIFFD